MGKCQGDCGIPQPSLQSEDMPQKPLDVSTLLFYPRAEEQQASLPGEQPRDANAARIHKSVRVCSHMVHQSTRCKKLQRVFIAIFQRRFNLVHHRVTRTVRARRRSGGQKRPSGAFLERGRVPDGAPEKAATNVAAFLLHHSLWDGLALRASARVRLAGTGR